MTDEATVRVSWYCGMYVGPPKWQPGMDWTFEPDECCAEGEAEVDAQDWEDGCAQVTCTSCGAVLEQGNDHLTLAEPDGSGGGCYLGERGLREGEAGG